MKIDELRIYAECLEQGLDFKEYFSKINKDFGIKNIYFTKIRGNLLATDSILQRISKLKDFDVIVTILCDSKEFPILLVEYSTAVPTDDHKMQRSDVYFWASIFQIPVLKISPLSKASPQKHGGGDKITLLQEINLALQQKAVAYFVDWQSKNSILLANPNKLSCIAYSNDIQNILRSLILTMEKCVDIEDFYAQLFQAQQKLLNLKELQNLKDNFTNSTRFQKTTMN